MGVIKRKKVVLTERRSICNFKKVGDTNNSENEVSNSYENCFHKEKEMNVEFNDIELSSEGSSGTVMVRSPTSVSEVNTEETVAKQKTKKI